MNKAKLIVFGSIAVIVILMLGVLTGILPGLRDRPPPPFTLEIWDTDQNRDFWSTIIGTYQRDVVTSATIRYTAKDPERYEAELLDALAAGRGPDIFVLSDVQLERHRDKVAPLPEGTLGYRARDLKGTFADSIARAITTDNGELLGIPLALDTLALFYNRDMFNAANIPNPPRTWDEFAEDAERLTRLSEVGGIRRSGAALGTAPNVSHAADIVVALIYQSGGTIVDGALRRSALVQPATTAAVSFYTSFANSTRKTYSWNAFFDDSLRAFARGESAMAIGYAADVLTVARLNPQLNFDVAPLPQTNLASPVNLGRFNLFVVSRVSPEPENAWRFLLWLRERDQQKLYGEKNGLPPARRDLVTAKPPREYLIPFYDQVLSARVLPLELGESYAPVIGDMIEAVNNRRLTIEQAIRRAEDAINELFRPRQQT